MRFILFCLLLTLSLLWMKADAFNLKEMDEVTIEKAIPCGEFICALVSKDGSQFILIGRPIDGVFYTNSVFLVEGQKAKKVWDVTWKEV